MDKWLRRQKRLARKFKLSVDDIHNLYDLFHIVDNPPQIQINFRKTLKLNKMDKWFKDLFERLENIALDELKTEKTKKNPVYTFDDKDYLVEVNNERPRITKN